VPFAGTLALAWLFAEISYRCYETPFLRLKERWSRVG
jgi:peptidoglycan/LPS O-acetylase OafA/YrhL